MNRHMRRAVLTFSIHNREKKAERILAFLQGQHVSTAILVGCSPGKNANEGILERAVSGAARVQAACDILVSTVEWPFVLADGRHLPFGTHSTDLILANAVIEHVGDEDDQRRFVAEQTRVAGCWVITTPNRWFPVESHTSTIFKHWSRRWRASHDEFTRLLSLREFRALLPGDATIRGRPWSATFTAFYVTRS